MSKFNETDVKSDMRNYFSMSKISEGRRAYKILGTRGQITIFTGQQIKSKINNFQNANFLISQPHWLRYEKVIMKVIMKTVLLIFHNYSPDPMIYFPIVV